MSKKRTIKQYAQALYEVTKDKSGKELDEVLSVFVELLARDRKFKKVDQIIESFGNIIKQEEGVVEIEVVSTRKLGEDLKKKITEIFGKYVEMKEEIDKKLIGGVIVKTEDTILDGSVRTQLKLLKQTLV